MSVNKFKFVSPGVFIDEIDQSQLPAVPVKMGPVIIGRAERGPAMKPVTVNSFLEFTEIFGDPIPGGKADDVWRSGNYSGPTYGAFAAQAYLRNNSPITFVRLLGKEHSLADATLTNKGLAGWNTTKQVSPDIGDDGTSGGAYGLFVIASGSMGAKATGTINVAQGTLAASHATMAVSSGDYITITDGVGTKIDYVASDTGAGGGQGSGTVLISGETDNVNTGTTHTITSGASKAVAVGINITGGDNQYTFLSVLKAAIEHANGHAGTLTITGLPGSADASAQGMTLENVLPGASAAMSAENFTVTIGAFAGGVDNAQAALTGTLAAVWYMDQGTVELTGSQRNDGDTNGGPTSGSCVLVQSLGGSGATTEFKIMLKDTDKSKIIDTSFNFDPSSDKYIRKVFNTNPMLTNSNIYSTTKKYWLGETFERSVAETLTGTGAGKAFGVVLGLSSGSATQYEYSKQRKESINAETGWIISQDLGNVIANTANDYDGLDQDRAKRLFRFVAMDTGEWNQNNLKVSIIDIKPAKSDKTWPTFAVELRRIADSDKSKQIIEKYSNLNMNPSSPNYIGRRIGTKFTTWNTTDRRVDYHGDYDNVSKFMRVVVHEDSPTREHMPFGSYGPIRFRGFTIKSGSTFGKFAGLTAPAATFVEAAGDISQCHVSASRHAGDGVHVGNFDFTGSFKFPAIALRTSASEGGIVDDTKAYFGADTTKAAAGNIRFENSVKDAARSLPGQTKDAFDIVDSPVDYVNAERSWVFTLDDVGYDNNTKRFHYVSGSRQLGTSWTALSGTNNLLTASAAGINKFTTVFYGGFDGLDIKEREPFRNQDVLGAAGDDGDEKLSYAYHTLMRAIDVVRDPEQVECNLMTIPGVTNRKITERLVRTCEERADALAIIDIENDFVPDTENTSDDATRLGDIDQAVNSMKDRELDSSYGAAYYPWVQVKDRQSGVMFWCPPSVVALGAMAYSEAVKDVWFAPAGFSRGGLTATGAGGLTVTGVRQHLTSKQRDKLYDVNVNPIASFPAEGLVIFGQKTLQLTASALDRINVRRLLIFLKKEISRIASQTLFEQNVKDTWNGFSGHVDKILNDVRVNYGLTDYKLILDETTTTPEMVDRNIMYAKIFLKPARAIEFIALDFIITSSGASFED